MLHDVTATTAAMMKTGLRFYKRVELLCMSAVDLKSFRSRKEYSISSAHWKLRQLSASSRFLSWWWWDSCAEPRSLHQRPASRAA